MSKSIKLKNNVYLDGKSVKHNFIQVSNSANQAVNQEWYNVQLNAWSNGYGSSFTLSNNRVYIGSGVSKVSVSCCVFAENAGSWLDYWQVYIQKNGTSYANVIQSGTPKYFQTAVVSPIVIDVNSGDYINLLVNNPNISTGQFTLRGGANCLRLVVEAID